MVRVDAVERERLRAELAPISESYLRKLLRACGVPLTAAVEGERQEDFAALERTLLAATDRAAVLLAKRHAELVCRSSRGNRPVKTEMPVKIEMIEWMRVWLETPDAFAVWVKLRKSTAEWQALQNFQSP